MKLRAFHTITAILGVLWLCCISYLIGIALNESTFLSKGVKCVIEMIINWFNLPSSLTSTVSTKDRKTFIPMSEHGAHMYGTFSKIFFFLKWVDSCVF